MNGPDCDDDDLDATPAWVRQTLRDTNAATRGWSRCVEAARAAARLIEAAERDWLPVPEVRPRGTRTIELTWRSGGATLLIRCGTRTYHATSTRNGRTESTVWRFEDPTWRDAWRKTLNGLVPRPQLDASAEAAAEFP